MKGVILAGGLGTRLAPLTRVTNKHLLPVYDRPMIYYPIQCLVNAGIEDIMIVTGGNDAGDFLRLLGNGHEFGLRDLHYTYQEGESGIADACETDGPDVPDVTAVGSRYVEITPDAGGGPVALRVTSSDEACINSYVQAPEGRRYAFSVCRQQRLVSIEQA